MTDTTENSTPETVDEIQFLTEDCIRHTVAPIPAEHIREYFVNKELFFVVNHSESKLQGASFLTYLTNLAIPSDIKFNYPMPYEEYELVMKAYFAQKSIIETAGLHVMAADLLLVAKGYKGESPYTLPIEPEHRTRFINENSEVIERCLHFIDSTQVFALTSIKKLAEHYTPAQRFDTIDDRDYVPSNVAMLYCIPEFITIYFSGEDTKYKLSYFKQQYEEYIFKNNHLAHYFNSKNNLAALLFQHYAIGTFSTGEVTEGMFKIGVFDPNGPHYEKTPYETLQTG